jgi:hypothetical protein
VILIDGKLTAQNIKAEIRAAVDEMIAVKVEPRIWLLF